MENVTNGKTEDHFSDSKILYNKMIGWIMDGKNITLGANNKKAKVSARKRMEPRNGWK